jgi:hypothetical protein
VRRGSGVLSPATHTHPLFSFFSFWTTQHEIQHKHPWEAHPAWDLNPANLAVVSGECLPSTTLPSAPTKHTHIHGPAEFPSFEKILPLRWDSNPLAPGPRPRSTVSHSHAATELPRFLFIETTETEKKTKKKTRLFIDGHFEVILCLCQFDNF